MLVVHDDAVQMRLIEWLVEFILAQVLVHVCSCGKHNHRIDELLLRVLVEFGHYVFLSVNVV